MSKLLIDELIKEILGELAALPLLQFTLLKLWERRSATESRDKGIATLEAAVGDGP